MRAVSKQLFVAVLAAALWALAVAVPAFATAQVPVA